MGKNIKHQKLLSSFREIHKASRENYGSPRITRELHEMGYHEGHNRVAKLMQALKMAIKRRHPAPGLIHHSDHGSQYTSRAMQDLLALHGILASMGSVGDCYDNAVAESGFATLKKECVYRFKFLTRNAARMAVCDYIEVFYNRTRRHLSLGYLGPLASEDRFYQRLPLPRVHYIGVTPIHRQSLVTTRHAMSPGSGCSSNHLNTA